MHRSLVSLAVEAGIVGLIFLEHIVNGSQEHSGNSDNCFLVPRRFLRRGSGGGLRETAWPGWRIKRIKRVDSGAERSLKV